MAPLYIVEMQCRTLMAVGIAMRKVMPLKMLPASTDWPLTNMWWPHTRKLRMAMATLDRAMKL